MLFSEDISFAMGQFLNLAHIKSARSLFEFNLHFDNGEQVNPIFTEIRTEFGFAFLTPLYSLYITYGLQEHMFVSIQGYFCTASCL